MELEIWQSVLISENMEDLLIIDKLLEEEIKFLITLFIYDFS